MTVLVTGATGLIGRYLVAQLLDLGAAVRILTRDAGRIPPSWGGQVESMVGDLTEGGNLARVAEGVTVVHHLAGELRQRDLFYATNVSGTQHLLEACRSAGVSTFIHYSSVGVIGPRRRGTINESTPCRPTNAYERSKYEGEKLALAFGHTYGIRTVVLRPTNVFGEGRAGSLARWMAAIQCRQFRYIGHGGIANYIYAADVAEVGIELAARENGLDKVFIVSDPCGMDEFVQTMADALGVTVRKGRIPYPVALAMAVMFGLIGGVLRVSPPLTLGRVHALTTRCVYSPERLRRLGIVPRVGVREGLQRSVAWYRTHGIL